MRAEVMWAIRDARGLNANEKALLWTVESRGVAFGTAATMAADCGMGDNRFYKWRGVLREKNLLIITERPGMTTEYRVNAGALPKSGLPRDGEGGHPPETEDPTSPPQIEEGGHPESGKGVSPDRGAKEEPQEHPQEELLPVSALRGVSAVVDVWEQVRIQEAFVGDDDM